MMPMNKKTSMAALLFFTILITSTALFQIKATITDESSYFSDHFDNELVDPLKWVIQENTQMSGHPAYGGKIGLADSNIMLSSNGSSFPYVRSVSNPFPSEGDFCVQLNVTYICIGDWGSGIMFGEGVPYIDQTPNGIFGGDSGWKNRVFTLWAADQGPNQGVIYIEMFNTLVWKTYIQGFKPSSAPHLYKLTYTQGVYTVHVDGKEVASVPSQKRPNTIVVGSPPLYYLPQSPQSMEAYGYWGWSSFNLDYISVTQTMPAKISASAYTETLLTGYRVNINGNLTTPEGKPLSDENVVISYSIPGTSSWNPISAATTDLSGFFEVAWISPATGKFSVKAEWAGNEAYSTASDIRNISILQDIGKNLFTAESNSSLSSLSFNATSKEIAFSVSGPSGSAGYVRFMISKTLIDNQTDFKVYLDAKQINFTASSMGDFFVLYFEYHHSSNEVTIIQYRSQDIAPISTPTAYPSSSTSPTIEPSLEPSPTPDNNQETDYAPAIVLGSVAAVNVIVLFYSRRRK